MSQSNFGIPSYILSLEQSQRASSHGVTVQGLGRVLAVAMATICPVLAVYVGGDVIVAADFFLPAVAVFLLLGQKRGRWEACYWALLVFIGLAFLSLLQIEDQRLQIRSGMKWVRLVGICLPIMIGLRLYVDRRLLLRVGWGLFIGGLIAMIAAAIIYVFQIPIRPEGQRLWFRGGSQFRAGGLIGETTAFGHLTATWMTLVFSLLVWTEERSQRRNWVLLTIGTIGLGMIFLSSSRAALLNLMVFVVSLWLMGRVGQRTFRNLMVLLTCVLLTIVLAITLMFGVQRSGLLQGGERLTRQLERFAPLGSADRFSSGRLEAWQIYSRKIRNHLWLGCGYKTATKLVHNRTPDNSVLSALLETGLLGLLALCSFAILTTLTLWKRGVEGEPFSQALSAAWMGQVAQALTNDTHTLLLGIPVLYLVTGLVLQLDRSNSSQ